MRWHRAARDRQDTGGLRASEEATSTTPLPALPGTIIHRFVCSRQLHLPVATPVSVGFSRGCWCRVLTSPSRVVQYVLGQAGHTQASVSACVLEIPKIGFCPFDAPVRREQ